MSFGAELLKSANEALEIAKGDMEPGFVYVPEEVDVAAIRRRKRMSQGRFAASFGLALGTLRDWEQRRRAPDRTARILLSVIDQDPDAVRRALNHVHA